ncbi:hypothetical protein [Taylorella equigenitalis]|nr:DNA cytosine methyltransferase [Taylorella equigenitalis]WDU47443.1 DNA cytosine methyltransferase [Taylorella equigenitalis]WDU48898.1 DNA cytosine methyltransferase [Taylorella equigenitalis]WDU52937.1 DNA cytosine methyltransferase [Taylorella equigenitalis]WDU54395.1 DNA cytosine methyltransferase [Taylorella equigenitalis]
MAADFGVSQSREKVIFIGVQKNLCQMVYCPNLKI